MTAVLWMKGNTCWAWKTEHLSHQIEQLYQYDTVVNSAGNLAHSRGLLAYLNNSLILIYFLKIFKKMWRLAHALQ
jgi:hypothetical protein